MLRSSEHEGMVPGPGLKTENLSEADIEDRGATRNFGTGAVDGVDDGRRSFGTEVVQGDMEVIEWAQ